MSGCTDDERRESSYFEHLEKRLSQIERRLTFLEDRMAMHEKKSFCEGISDK